MNSSPLNAAGRIARMFIDSKLTIVFIVASLALGALALALTPREENPQIQVSGAIITMALPGASPTEVEHLLVTPLEGLLHGMSGVDSTQGTARSGVATVQVQFKTGQQKETTLVRVYERILNGMASLPQDAGAPGIRSIDADSVPIVAVTLASEAYDEDVLLQLAERMAEKLYSVDGVSTVEVRGGQPRELRVAIDPMRMQSYDITLDQLYAALKAANNAAFLEDRIHGGSVYGVMVDGFLASAEDVRSLVVGVHNDRPVYLEDIATIRTGIPAEERSRLSRFAFGSADARRHSAAEEMPSISIAVAKKKGTNAVSVADDVILRMEGMKSSLMPQNVHMVVTRDDGNKASDAVNTLLEHLAIAILSVGLVLIPFLGWRDACIVMGTVPLIFAQTLGADFFGGVTINRITLFALIVAMGLLVDAAIVVLENIHRHYASPSDMGKTERTIFATNEVGNATNLATFAIMLVFASLLLVTDMAGDYFYPMAYNLPICMIFSLLVAYIVVPWAALRCMPMQCHAVTPQKMRLQYFYERSFIYIIASTRRKYIFFTSIAVLLCLSLLMGGWQFFRPAGVGGPVSALGVGLGFLPKDNYNTFNIVVTMPETAAIEETDRLTRQIGRLVTGHPQVTDIQSWVGMAGVMDFNSMIQGTSLREGSHVAEIRVNLVNKKHRAESSIDIVRALRPGVADILRQYPGARARLVEDPPGPPVQAMVLAQLHGPDAEGLRAVAARVEQEFANTFDMMDISTSEPVDVPQQRILPDKTKIALSGVSEARVYQALQWAYGGWVAGRLHHEDERVPMPVRVLAPRALQLDPRHLDQLQIRNGHGQPVPLSTLVSVHSEQKERPISHKDTEKVVFIGGEMHNSPPLYAVLDLDARLSGMATPDGGVLKTGNLSFVEQVPNTLEGYQLLWGGEMRLTLDVYRDLLVALGTALVLVYLLLVAYYRSFVIPAIAMIAIPLGLIGIFPGHWLVGMDFSATSIIGIIALSGVVIRNSLLLIDFTRELVEAGRPLHMAAVEAGSIRLKPIVLTTLAIVLGSMIMLTDPVFGGLSISLIFGTCLSTVFTIFIVPMLLLHALQKKEPS